MTAKKPTPGAMSQMASALAKPAPTPRAVKVRGSKARADLQQINSPKTNQGKNELFKEGGDTMASKMNPGFVAMMAKKKGAKEGGKADMKQDKSMMQKAVNKHEGRLHKGEPMTKLAKGGMSKMGAVKTAAPSKDGVAVKGKTKGTMVKMMRGGKAC